ncbi:MAG: HDOD domain-containing protein [Marinobacter sp.]
MDGRQSLPLRHLKSFQPLARLTEDQLILVANRAQRRSYGAGQRVLEHGARDGLEYFLIAGAVELASSDGRKSVIEAETDKALNPVARLQPRMYDVTATSACEFLVIEQDVLNQMLRSAPASQAEMHSTDSADDDTEENHLLMEFYAELRSNQVRLPSVPDVAWKVRRIVDREDSMAEDVAAAVSADPAIAIKLVRACNSPLYRGFNDVRNVREAVIRLGMNATRQLVTVFAMREIFKTRRASLEKEMEKLWRHSREVAALSRVLAEHATRIDPEEAMLAGLLHDIGVVPILVQAEHHQNLFADEQKLRHAVADLRADIGCAVLENWSFPKPFVDVARYAEDWHHECPETEPQLVDVVIVAQLHAMIGASQNDNLPSFEEVPAWRRLGALDLNASRSLQLLSEAREKVDEVHKLLSIR